MRLFVAIVPPAEVTAALDGQLRGVRQDWPGLRWTGPADWHVTLAFLGEVTGDMLPGLETRLERAARRHDAQHLAVRGIGTFPGPARARVLWAGIQARTAGTAGTAGAGSRAAGTGAAPSAPPGLRALAASVAAGARRAGAPPPDEDRRYRPHITLARLNAPADLRELTAGLAGLACPDWTAAQIELIRSHPPGPGKGERPWYQALAAWPLRDHPP